jgi:hypothetical protein
MLRTGESDQIKIGLSWFFIIEIREDHLEQEDFNNAMHSLKSLIEKLKVLQTQKSKFSF